MPIDRFVCVHGHFYQPPRENPWLEDIEVQDSARPFHDWNERITHECYGPNGASRILDPQNRIVEIVNNYESISFNFGPTLLRWLEEKSPATHQKIVAGDVRSRSLFGGHGNALAQVYNHIIMPLADRRDKETQILWGLRDFERRFGRKPEGMWLAETAVDSETLDLLSAHGILFTLLSPTQALRIRPADGAGAPDAVWEDVSGGRIDPSRPYLWRSATGRTLALFFYDAPLSRAVAFEGVLNNGEGFANRLASGFDDGRTGAQLVHVATDGESYGHHHRYGDMALAFALRRLREKKDAALTNYGQFLENNPPTRDVEIVENSSWSCPHGVERWRSDCGCRMGYHAGWTQAWRGPLRRALDRLRNGLDALTERESKNLLKNPWAARNDYIDVILDRGAPSVDRFLETHAGPFLSGDKKTLVLKLMEIQRHRLLMYTSCAWFFDEISGLESTAVLASAARALHLAREITGHNALEEEFLKDLSLARSNVAEFGTGDSVYRRMVLPLAADARRVAAHQALSTLFNGKNPEGRIYCFDFRYEDLIKERKNDQALAEGKLKISSPLTLESETVSFAALHRGRLEFTGGLRVSADSEAYKKACLRVLEAFRGGELDRKPEILTEFFSEGTISLKDLFLEERRRILGSMIESFVGRFEIAHRHLVEEFRPLIIDFQREDIPLPQAFRLGLEFVLGRDMHEALVLFKKDEKAGAELISRVVDDTRRYGVALNWDAVKSLLQSKLEDAVTSLEREKAPAQAARALSLLTWAEQWDTPLSLWKTENIYFDIWHKSLKNHPAPALKTLAERLRFVT